MADDEAAKAREAGEGRQGGEGRRDGPKGDAPRAKPRPRRRRRKAASAAKESKGVPPVGATYETATRKPSGPKEKPRIASPLRREGGARADAEVRLQERRCRRRAS